MNSAIESYITQATGACSAKKEKDIQSLWSGYGSISRYHLVDGEFESVVVKHVKLPDSSDHPRGWNTQRSHQRKIRSYHVECEWYRTFATRCDQETCRVAKCLGTRETDDEFIIIMEDLDASGFSVRKDRSSLDDMKSCLRWLAFFHATFMFETPAGIWPIGTYWHLDTRPDELKALEDTALRESAYEIDIRLKNAPFQTLVHGDAKLTNFCFAIKGNQVAAVDFQYVGGGCGMKDVAYFIGSCLHEEDCQEYEDALLDYYFRQLKTAMSELGKNINATEIESAWRPLFSWAWTDFHRFVKGWSPGHWKVHSYSERLAKEVVASITQKTK